MAGPNDKNPPKDPKKDPTAADMVNKQQQGASEKPSVDASGKPGIGGKLTENAVGLANAFTSLVKGSANLKDSLETVGNELGKHKTGGKAAALPFLAAQKTFDIGDSGRENYKKLAEAISASTGSITGSFVETGENIDMFSDRLKTTAQQTGQSFETIAGDVSRLMKTSSDIGSSLSAVGDAATKTSEAFKAYADIVTTSRNVGMELNESLDLSEQLFKQQGLTIENTSDNAESALGTMRMLNKAIEGTGVSIQAATRFVKENAAAYEFLNWSSRKTSLTLGAVASFAKQNKDIFKSTEQGVNLYGKALQGTAAVQQDFGKSMFFGLMGKDGSGKGGLQAMMEFQEKSGPEAMQSIMDTVTGITGGNQILTHKEATASGDSQAQTDYLMRTELLAESLNLGVGEAMKLQDSMARFRAGDADAGVEAQGIIDAADPTKIKEADRSYQKQLYTSSELGNRILAGIRADTQRMASRVQSHINPEEATQIFQNMQKVLGDFAPEEAKEVMSTLKEGTPEKMDALVNKIKSAGSPEAMKLLDKVNEYRKKVDAGDPEADKVYQDAAKGPPGVGLPGTTPPSLPKAEEMPQQEQAPKAQAPQAAAPLGASAQPSAGQAQLGKTQPTQNLGAQQTATGGLQGLKAVKGVTIPELGMSTAFKDNLTYDAAAQTAFASGGALDSNVVGKIASGGSSEYEYGYGMNKKGIMSNKQKGLDSDKYTPEKGSVLAPPAASELGTSQTSPWTKVGEQITSKSASAPLVDATSNALTTKTQNLVDTTSTVDASELGAEHKPALDQFNKFIEQMKSKGTVDASSSVEGVNSVSSEHGIFAMQKAQASAKEQGKTELANALKKWEEVYTLGKDLQTTQTAQTGEATSKEVAYSKLTTETSGFDASGAGLGIAQGEDDPNKLASKYVAPSKGNFMSAFGTPTKPTAPLPKSQKSEVLSSKDFPSAASLQIPQLDGGAAQAVIMDKKKKETAAAQEAAKKTASASTQPLSQSQQGSPLTAQVVLNVNGNALMEQLVQTQAFEKGVKNQVVADKSNTYKNFGNKA